jgi:phasin family protein
MASKKDAEPTVKAVEFAKDTSHATAAAVKHGFDHSVAALQDGVSGVVAGFEKTQQEIQANMDKAMKTAEEFISFGQGNVEAVMKSGQIWAAGVQEFGKTFASLAQAQMDHTVATWKALAGVKSLKDAVDLQTSLARTSIEAAMNETGKLTDASLKLAEQAAAPITARVTLAVEKFGRAA